jgi:hypothetical protein
MRPAALLLPLAAVATALATAWIYRPVVHAYLLTDDFQWLEGAMVFTPHRLFDLAGRTHFYRPAVELYFALMYRGVGCSATMLHVANILLHVVNAALVMVLAQLLTADVTIAALAGLLFATQPALAQAVLWPAAMSSVLCAFCGLAMLIADSRREGVGRSGAVVAAFAAALAAHESGVMFLPAALLLRYGRGGARPCREWLRLYLPCALLLLGYVGLTGWINSRNYVITEGHYRAGLHIVVNLFDYLVALYEGRHRPLDYAFVAGAVALLAWQAPRRIRMWLLWLFAALAPVLAFTTPPASRYLYIPSIPFSLLVAAGVVALARRAGDVVAPRHRRPLVAAVLLVLTLFIAGRAALFARKGAYGFVAEATPFARVARDLRPTGDGTTVTIPAEAVDWMDPQYLQPLARVAACDPHAVVVTR